MGKGNGRTGKEDTNESKHKKDRQHTHEEHELTAPIRLTKIQSEKRTVGERHACAAHGKPSRDGQ